MSIPPIINEQRKAQGRLCRALRELIGKSPEDAVIALGVNIEPFALMAYEHENPKMLTAEDAEKVLSGLKALAREAVRQNPQALSGNKIEKLHGLGKEAGISLADIAEWKNSDAAFVEKPIIHGYEPLIEGIHPGRIRNALRKLRDAEGWSINDIASGMNLSDGFVAQVESGFRPASEKTLRKLLQTFECDSFAALLEKAAALPNLSQKDARALMLTICDTHQLSREDAARALELGEKPYRQLVIGSRPTLMKHLVKMQRALHYPTFGAMIDHARSNGYAGEPLNGSRDAVAGNWTDKLPSTHDDHQL